MQLTLWKHKNNLKEGRQYFVFEQRKKIKQIN